MQMERKHLQASMAKFVGVLHTLLHAHHYTQIYSRRRRAKVGWHFRIDLYNFTLSFASLYAQNIYGVGEILFPQREFV